MGMNLHLGVGVGECALEAGVIFFGHGVGYPPSQLPKLLQGRIVGCGKRKFIACLFNLVAF